MELIFALGVLVCVIFGSFFEPWEHFWSAGGYFLIIKTVWATKGAPRGISPKILSLLWIHFGVIFRVFFDFGGSVFKLRFLLSSGADFSWILASFGHMFLIFFVIVDTCGFSDL